MAWLDGCIVATGECRWESDADRGQESDELQAESVGERNLSQGY